MRYIDKYPRHDESLALNVRYLKSIYSRNLQHPDPSPAEGERSFKSFSRFKNNWKPLLFEEQKVEGASRCCYCMRKLDESKGLTNIEHVIPKTLAGVDGQSQYAYYSSLAPALKDHVMMADDFTAKSFMAVSDIDKETKMPHTTALSNLVISCNGTRDTFNAIGCCCNNARGDNKIMPIMLMPNANTDVKYDANGIISISCNDGTLNDIIDDLNTTTLQEIRSVWYHLSRITIDINNAENMPKIDRVKWFKEAYSTDNFATLPEDVKKYSCVLDSANADTYWKILLAYDWFYYYPEYASQRVTA